MASTITSATFVGLPPVMDFGNGLVSDGSGVIAAVATGAAGGSNAGAAVLNVTRAGGISLPPQTAGYLAARTAALAAIAVVTDASTKAAFTAILATVTGLTAE
jgi:hypothetical protein